MAQADPENSQGHREALQAGGPPSAGDLSEEGLRREAEDRPRVKDVGVLPLHSCIYFFFKE